MINGFVVLLGCQLIGEVVVRFISIPVPGPVVGAALLAIALVWRGVPDWLGPVAHGVLRHLSLLFVPAAVGVMQYRDILSAYGMQLIGILMISTALAMGVTATVFVILTRGLADPSAPDT